MKRSRFLIFIFSFIPGAGQMYQGYMKRGSSLMALFSLIIGIGTLGFSFVTIALPVVWFYAFFDTFNLANTRQYDHRDPSDDYLFHLGALFAPGSAFDLRKLVGKRHVLIGAGCVAAGCYTLLTNLLRPFIFDYNLTPDWVRGLYYRFPTLVVAVAIIWLGIWLLRSGKTEKPNDDVREFKGRYPEFPPRNEQ